MKKLRIFISVLLICLSFSAPALAAPKSEAVIEGVHTDNTPVVSSVSGQEIEINKSIINIDSPESVDVKLTLKSYGLSVPKTADPGIGFLIIFITAGGVAIIPLLRKRGSKAVMALFLAVCLISALAPIRALASIQAAAYAQSAKPSFTVTESFSDEMLKAFTFDEIISDTVKAETIRDSGGKVTGITWKTNGTSIDQGVSYRFRTNENVPDELFEKEINVSSAALAFTSLQGKKSDMVYPDVSVILKKAGTIIPEPETPLGELPPTTEPSVSPTTSPTTEPSVPPTIPPTIPPTTEPVVTLTLIYNANGGTGSDIVLHPESGSSVTIADNSFDRQDYSFVSWNIEPDGTGVTYMPGEAITITSDITLYAQWQAVVPATYTVLYDANGGNGMHADTDIAADSQYTVKNTAQTGISRASYNFVSWNTEPDGTGVAYTPDEIITITSNMTLYAWWQVINPID